MRTTTLLLVACLSTAVYADDYPLPAPCADTGESSASRAITPLESAPLPVSEVPATIAERARSRWLTYQYGFHVPAGAEQQAQLTSARIFRLPNKKVFYLLTIKGTTSLFSRACPDLACSNGYWWNEGATIRTDRDRAPAGVPGDEFYVTTDKTPSGQAILWTSDPFSEQYDLAATCLVRLTLKERK